MVDFYGPSDYGKLAELRRDHPERFNMASLNRHAAHGGGIHYFGLEQLDAAGLEKLHRVSPLAAVHKGMPPFLVIQGNKDDQVAYEQSTEFCDAMKKSGCRLRADRHRRRRPRNGKLEGGRHAALEARNDRLAEEDPEGEVMAIQDSGGEHIERVRRICMAMPEVTEKLSHGEPTFFVRKKVFAMLANNHHDDGHIEVWIPAPPGLQEALIDTSPESYDRRPTWVCAAGWGSNSAASTTRRSRSTLPTRGG